MIHQQEVVNTEHPTWHGVHKANSKTFSSDKPGINIIWVWQVSVDSADVTTLIVTVLGSDVTLSSLSDTQVTDDFLTMLKIITTITGIPNNSENMNEFLHLKPHANYCIVLFITGR